MNAFASVCRYGACRAPRHKSGADDRENASDVQRLGGQIGGIRRQQRDDGLDGRIVDVEADEMHPQLAD